MITENGFTAELDCVTAYRPAYPGHDNSSVNALLFLIHDIEDGRDSITEADVDLMIGAAGSDDGIIGDAWLDKPTTESSVHFGVYPGVAPRGIAQCLPLSIGCWGAGAHANYCAIQAEQSGVAAYNIAQWLTAAGREQLDNMATLYAELCVHFGWVPHWATDAEIVACANGSTSQGHGGATYHADWSRLFPADTTHTDPGLHYPGKAAGAYTAGQIDPGDLFMPLARAKFAALTGAPTAPAPITTGDTMAQSDIDAINAHTDKQLTAAVNAIWHAPSGLPKGSPGSMGGALANTQQITVEVRSSVIALAAALTTFSATVKAGLAHLDAKK